MQFYYILYAFKIIENFNKSQKVLGVHVKNGSDFNFFKILNLLSIYFLEVTSLILGSRYFSNRKCK